MNPSLPEPTDTSGVGPVKDAVCGKTINPQATPWSVRYDNVTYYFCSLACALQFKAAPHAYLT